MGKKQKDPHAVHLGRLGGYARRRKLTSEQRREIARKAAHARWAKKKPAEWQTPYTCQKSELSRRAPGFAVSCCTFFRAQAVELPEQALCEPNFSIRCGCYPCDTGVRRRLRIPLSSAGAYALSRRFLNDCVSSAGWGI